MHEEMPCVDHERIDRSGLSSNEERGIDCNTTTAAGVIVRAVPTGLLGHV